jgi:hypothetical protein
VLVEMSRTREINITFSESVLESSFATYLAQGRCLIFVLDSADALPRCTSNARPTREILDHSPAPRHGYRLNGLAFAVYCLYHLSCGAGRRNKAILCRLAVSKGIRSTIASSATRPLTSHRAVGDAYHSFSHTTYRYVTQIPFVR